MNRKGFTLVEIMIVVAIIALLTAIAIPAFLQYRRDARRSLCINNMRLIDHAKEVLAIKFNWTAGQVIALSDAGIWSQLDAYIDGDGVLYCPDAGTTHYDYNPVDSNVLCTLYVSGAFTEHLYVPGAE